MSPADSGYLAPEQHARQRIDAMLEQAGWVVQDYRTVNLYAGLGVAVRELPTSAGPADYVLFVNRQAVGVIEAKKVGTTLSGVEPQTLKYQANIPGALPSYLVGGHLPFGYESTGAETWFTCRMDPEPTARRVFWFHRPDSLARPRIDSRYLVYWLANPVARTHIEQAASSTSGLHVLSGHKLRGIVVPVAPLAKQERIVAAIEEHLSRVDVAEASLVMVFASDSIAGSKLMRWAQERERVRPEPGALFDLAEPRPTYEDLHTGWRDEFPIHLREWVELAEDGS